jgi:hypothetical protein
LLSEPAAGSLPGAARKPLLPGEPVEDLQERP